MTKAQLRIVAAAVRRAAALAAPDAAERLVQHWPAQLRPTVVAGYCPLRDELDPTPLMLALAVNGARLCLPVTSPRGSDAGLVFHLWRPGDALARSGFGVFEPHASAPQVTPDLLLVPLLAFDRAGGRLGYGAGHYDRTLASRSPRPLAIGVAYAAQERSDLPLEPHDEPLDGILTEQAYIPVQRG